MKKIILAAATVLVMALTGCAPLNFYGKLDPMLVSGDYKSADELVEKSKEQYKGQHEMLYYFDKGAILQMAGDYKGSVSFLEQADLKIDELYTKSATQEIGSFFSNDMNLPYDGENFEQVMVNVMKCLDFLYADNFQDAQIEARKVNNRMNLLVDKFEGKTTYKDDAFARYLSALSYEGTGKLNDAYIDYKASYKAYQEYEKLYGTPVPQQLKKDLLRISEAIKFYDDYDGYKKDFEGLSYVKQQDMKGSGEFVIVVYDGMAPVKESKFLMHSYYDEKANKYHQIPIAFPHFKAPRPVLAGASASYKTAGYEGFVAEDVGAIAVKSLEERNVLIMAKAVARAITKFVAKQALSNGGKNAMMDMLGTIYQFASEQADTRSWRTLPNKFYIIRGRLAPGKYDLKVTLTMADGTTREEVVKVKIKDGKKDIVPLFALK